MNRVSIDKEYADLLTIAGISVREVLVKSQLPGDLFRRKMPTVSVAEYYRLMEAVGSLSTDENTLIKFGTAEKIETFSPPIFAAYCSKNALTCLYRLARYKKLIGPLIFIIEQDLDYVTLEVTSVNTECDLPVFLVAFELVFVINLIRKATKAPIVPLDVSMECKLENRAFDSFLGAIPKIGAKNILKISKEDALKPFISQNDAMWDYFEPELKRRLDELDIDDTTAARVRSALIELLPEGYSGIEEVSRQLGYSKRTLQRKLKDENTTFQKQLNHTRTLLAKHYLKNTDMTSDVIAYLLGYQDLNSFIRSFSIWTSMTISEYKKSIINST